MSKWIEWNGGECPVDKKQEVDCILRSGSNTGICYAEELVWKHYSDYGDIISYKTIGDVAKAATPDHYKPTKITSQMVGQPLDPAFIALHYNLSPMMFTALKKVLRCGNSIKDKKTDIAEIKGALDRELQLMGLSAE